MERTWSYAVGLRVVVAFAGHLPMVALLSVVPAYALWTGTVANPDILLSNIMVATPLLQSCYTSGASS